jgi:5-methylcytosine-specific restriction protein A
MPPKAKKPCSYPGCPALTTERFCEKHKQSERKRYDNQRGTAAQRGYGYRWQLARIYFLMQYPLCAECGKNGKVVSATVVDHIIPHKGNQELFWDTRNWQPLCKRCHDVKTVKEDGAFGNNK